MFAEGETELRDMVAQNLESCGFLSKIKAELRAGVFLALSEEGSLRKKVPLFNKKLDEFIESPDGKLALSVVREFLEYFNLNFTLSVFDPEIATTTPFDSRSDLLKKFDLNELDSEGPILAALINKRHVTKATNSEKNNLHKTISKSLTSTDKDSFIKEIMKENVEEPVKNYPDLNKDIFNNNDKISEINNKNFKSTSILSSTNERSNVELLEKSDQKDIFKNTSSDLDPFFDAPLPSEKSSFFNLTSGSELGDLKKPSSYSYLDKTGLSSLRDLPSLTKNDSNLSIKSSSADDFFGSSESLKTIKNPNKDVDHESNEESSERQMNSEESIEEDIEEDFSAGIDDLLNSSLSLGDDATSDQTVSQTSVIEGVDHMEPCNSVN